MEYKELVERYIELFYSIENREGIKCLVISKEDYSTMVIGCEYNIFSYNRSGRTTLFGIPVFASTNVKDSQLGYSDKIWVLESLVSGFNKCDVWDVIKLEG